MPLCAVGKQQETQFHALMKSYGHTAADSHVHTVFGCFPATMAAETVGHDLEIFPTWLFARKACRPCSGAHHLHYKHQ